MVPAAGAGPRAPVVVITGGAGDIGAAVAARAAQSGATPVVADLHPGPVAGAEHVHLDLTDDGSITEAVHRIRTAYGAPRAVVHCAGVAHVGPFLDSDPEIWDLLYRVNQRGPARLTQLLLPDLIRAGEGRVVFIASDSARAGAANEAVYSATKSALLGLARSLAREHARAGVTFNVVCPGPVDGQMVRRQAQLDPDHLAMLTRAIPLRRLADPDEVAAAVGWLIGPDGGYLTGQTLSVSGGITMY